MYGKTDINKLTIKDYKNMRRSSSRDTPPRRSRRSRSRIRRHDYSSDERSTPDRIGRRSFRGHSPPSPRRYSDRKDDYGRNRDVVSSRSYKVLCVSGLHTRASDELIKDSLYREYKRYGDITIRISHDVDQERVAYVCFRSSEDARDAKHSNLRIVIYDKVAVVEPVYESRSSRATSEVRRRPRSRSVTPDYGYYRVRSPVPPVPEQHPIERYERPTYGPPGPPHDFRRDVPLFPHHDFARVLIHRDPYGPPRHPYVPPPIPPSPHHYALPRAFPPRPPAPHFGEGFQFKKNKFPNYLHHIPPEEDPLATRTLFVGNLELNISNEELRRIFERYGIVEDIDIKRPPPGTGNAFAFVKFQNLDMAHRAKVELSGQYIGKYQCKIGFGKATPSTRIWVGGLGQWTSIPQLEAEFDRFGAIQKIDYIKGDTSAYIHFDSLDAAQAAVKKMRGFPLGGSEHKLRIDFADVPGMPAFKSTTFPVESHAPGTDENGHDAPGYEYWTIKEEPSDYGSWRGFRGRGRGRGHGYHNHERRVGYIPDADWSGKPETDYDNYSPGEPGGEKISIKHSPVRSMGSNSGSESHLVSARTLIDVARTCIAIWQGGVILKSSFFLVKLHLMYGDADIIENLIRNEDGKHILKMVQRLRLDDAKLNDISKRISASCSYAVFLGLAGSAANLTVDDASVTTRPLKNLVSYLKQKVAAGVISLVNKESGSSGVLYAFPPCPFSVEFLKRSAPDLSEESLKQDFLVIVVVKSGAA